MPTLYRYWQKEGSLSGTTALGTLTGTLLANSLFGRLHHQNKYVAVLSAKTLSCTWLMFVHLFYFIFFYFFFSYFFCHTGPDSTYWWWTSGRSPAWVTKLRRPFSLPFCRFSAFLVLSPIFFSPFKLSPYIWQPSSCSTFCLPVSFLCLPLPYKSSFQQFPFL